MKHSLFIISLVVTIVFISCKESDPNKNIDEGKIEGNIYTNEEIGWTIEIPKGWKIIDKEKVQAINDKGTKIIEETIDEKIDYTNFKNLIWFQKNKFNIFQSTSEPFQFEYDGEWEDYNADLKKVLFQAYENQRIKTDSTKTKTETIDGIDFLVYTFTIYNPKDEIIMKQTMYSTYINGFDFSANISYNNDKDRDVLLNVLRNSTFKRQHNSPMFY